MTLEIAVLIANGGLFVSLLAMRFRLNDAENQIDRLQRLRSEDQDRLLDEGIVERTKNSAPYRSPGAQDQGLSTLRARKTCPKCGTARGIYFCVLYDPSVDRLKVQCGKSYGGTNIGDVVNGCGAKWEEAPAEQQS